VSNQVNSKFAGALRYCAAHVILPDHWEHDSTAFHCYIDRAIKLS